MFTGFVAIFIFPTVKDGIILPESRRQQEKISITAEIMYNYMMSGSKAPDFDAYGLLRATHSHNPTQYSHIVGLSSHFYAHIGAGPKAFHPPMSKLMWA